MANFAETLEKFCKKSKLQSIWKNRPDLFDQVVKRIHSEAAVFTAVNRCKSAACPSFEKINQTIQFLEQNDFWRLNALSLYSHTKDPNVIKTLKLLQLPPVRCIWRSTSPNGYVAGQEVASPFAQSTQPQPVQPAYQIPPMQRYVTEVSQRPHLYDFVPQERYNGVNPYVRPNTFFNLQANKIQATSFGPDNRRWMALNEFRLLQQQQQQRNSQIQSREMLSFR